MIAPPVLITERVRLEPLGPQHSDGMFRMWSREPVCRHSGPAFDWAGAPIRLPAESPADSDRIIDFFVRMAADGLGFRWAMIAREEPVFVGAVGFNRLSPAAELAYHLRPEFWGRGLMREAAEAAVAWVRAKSPDVPVEAFIERPNTASRGLALRLGFTATGIIINQGAERYLLRPEPDGREQAQP